MAHPLDRPVWSALTTRLAPLADAHAGLAVPENAGRVVGQRKA